MRQEKLGHESIANAKRLWYPLLLSTNIQNLRIKELKPDSYSSNKEIEYIFLDASINRIRVLAICRN